MRTSSPSSICTPSALDKPVHAQEMIAVKRPGPRRPVKSSPSVPVTDPTAPLVPPPGKPVKVPAKRPAVCPVLPVVVRRPRAASRGIMSRDAAPALDVLADVRLGAQAHSLLVGAATLARDGLGRQVLSIQLAVLPGDGRCYLSLPEVLTLAREQEEDATHA